MNFRVLILCTSAAMCAPAAAGELDIPVNKVTASGVGEEIGTISAEETEYGVVFHPDIKGLTEGLHGFHIHQHADCSPGEKEGETKAGVAAGGHFDPEETGRHAGPYGDGHLGDLPALYVDASGKVTHPVLAPRIKIGDLEGHALMIHEGGDNYSDQPEKLGGGGARVACAVVK